jgi:tetratricopeptide (TPR) repeat protein
MPVLAYIPAYSAGFIWDDDYHVTRVHHLASVEGLARIWTDPESMIQYYPLVFSSFWVEYQLWGLNPMGYHAVNVLLHGLNAVLLWRILRHLAVPGAWMAAAVFALHPVHVESVAWVTEQKNTQSGAFYLGSMAAFLRFSFPSDRTTNADAAWWYGLALVLFVGALLSKTVACSLPAALVLILWWKRGQVRLRDFLALVPFFVVGLGLAMLTLWLEKHHVGAQGKGWNRSALEQCLMAGRAVWFYAGKLCWPQDLIFFYPKWHIDAGAFWQYLFPATAILFIMALWFARGRIGRGPLVAVLVFGGTLLPALGFFNVYWMRFAYVADHFQYLASAAWISLVVAVSCLALERAGDTGQRLGRVMAGGILAVLAGLTWHQARIYQDVNTLWTETLRKNPECWVAYDYFGIVAKGQRHLREARQCFETSLRLEPDHYEAVYQLGVLDMLEGKPAPAEDHFRAAVEASPNSAIAADSLGLALAQQGKLEGAVAAHQQALAILPDHGNCHLHMGVALARLKRLPEARQHFEDALRTGLEHPEEAHFNLGLLLVDEGDLSAASEEFAEAARMNPNYADAYHQRGLVLVRLGQSRQAIDCFRRAVELGPVDVPFRCRLALALQDDGQAEAAETQYQEAFRLNPRWPAEANQAAWRMATARHDRNGVLALDLAREVCQASGNMVPEFLDTLAAAWAETGHFDKAQATARQALDLATGKPDLERTIRERLAGYAKCEPFRSQ